MNQNVLTGTQTNFIDANHVQLIVQIGATGDPTAQFTLQVINPPPGNEPSNEYGGLIAQAGGNDASPTVQWTTPPPSFFQNGDTLRVGWVLGGGSRASSSHVHLDDNPSTVQSGNRQYATPLDQGGSDGNYGQTFKVTDYFGLLSPGTTVYMAVHATDTNGIDYYSPLAQSSVTSAVITPSNKQRWIPNVRSDCAFR